MSSAGSEGEEDADWLPDEPPGAATRAQPGAGAAAAGASGAVAVGGMRGAALSTGEQEGAHGRDQSGVPPDVGEEDDTEDWHEDDSNDSGSESDSCAKEGGEDDDMGDEEDGQEADRTGNEDGTRENGKADEEFEDAEDHGDGGVCAGDGSATDVRPVAAESGTSTERLHASDEPSQSNLRRSRNSGASVPTCPATSSPAVRKSPRKSIQERQMASPSHSPRAPPSSVPTTRPSAPSPSRPNGAPRTRKQVLLRPPVPLSEGPQPTPPTISTAIPMPSAAQAAATGSSHVTHRLPNASPERTQVADIAAMLLRTPSPQRQASHEQVMLRGTPQDVDDWQNFLRSIQNGRMAEGDDDSEVRRVALGSDPEREDDGDYNYLADNSRLEGDDDSDDEDVINEGELKGLLEDAAAKRSARLLHPSRPDPAAAGLHSSVHAHLVHDANGGTGSNVNVPLGVAVVAPIQRDMEPARCFSPTMLRTLQIQMHIHVQLLVQSLILSREALRKKPLFARVSMMSFSMLIELCTHCDITMAYKQLKSRPVYATPLRFPQEHPNGAEVLSNGGTLHSRSSLKSARSHGPPATVFEVPGMAFLPQLLFERIGLKQLHEAADDKTRQTLLKQISKIPFDGAHELRRFAPYFNPNYIVRKSVCKDTEDRFTPAEEWLFSLGMRRYGFLSFEPIRAMLLPTKTSEQLRTQYEKKIRRKANANNPIKRAKLDVHPLMRTNVEMPLLKAAVQLYGEDWDQIRAKMLPRYSVEQLRMAWMSELGRPDGTSRHLQPPPVFAADPAHLPQGLPPPERAAALTSTQSAQGPGLLQLQDVNPDEFDNDDLSTDSDEADEQGDLDAHVEGSAISDVGDDEPHLADGAAQAESPADWSHFSAQDAESSEPAHLQHTFEAHVPMDHPASEGSATQRREPTDLEVLDAMVKQGSMGDAVEAHRILFSQGIIDQSYTPEALMHRFRTILKASMGT